MIREPTLLILAALAPKPLHGYGIMQRVSELSDGRVDLRPGTLYAALDRLVAAGSLAHDREDVVDGRKRRYYRMTDAGAEAFRAEVQLLEANAETAKQQLGLRPETRLA